jgi:hypothetical protein
MSISPGRPRPKGLLPIAGGTAITAIGMVGILSFSPAVSSLALLAGVTLTTAGTLRRRTAARRIPPLAAAYPPPGAWPATPSACPAAGRAPHSAFAAAMSAWQRANPATRGPAPVQGHGSRHPT